MICSNIFSRIRDVFHASAAPDTPKPFHEVMGIFLKCMKIIGALPISSEATGWKVQLRSASFLFCAVVYGFGLTTIVLTISKMVQSFDGLPFGEKIYLQLLAFAAVPYCLIPPTTWIDSFNVENYLSSWSEFQDSFLRITQSPLMFGTRNITRRSVYFGSFLLVQFVAISQIYSDHVSLLVVVTVVLNLVYAMAIMLFWLISMIIVGNAGKMLAARFKDTVDNGLMSFQTMRDYHKLWIHLNELTTNTGNVLFRSYCMPLCMQLCFIVLLLYASVSFLVRGDHRLFFTYLTSSVSTLGALAVFCNQGYFAPIKVKSVQNELHKLNFLNANAKVLQEARRFLETIKLNPPLISLGGFVDVNREMMSSACATLTTYLVVVLQFRLNQT